MASLLRRLSGEAFVSNLRRGGLELLYLLTICALAGGVANSILEGSRPVFARQIIILSRAAQSLSEAVINTFTILLGTTGLYIIYLSGRQTGRRRIASIYFIAGVSILFIAIMIGLYMLQVKR